MSGRYQRTDQVDHLVIDGESIVLFQDRFVRLGPLGTALVTATDAPRTIDDLATYLAEAFGAPAHGRAVDATRAVVVELTSQGVLYEAEDD